MININKIIKINKWWLLFLVLVLVVTVLFFIINMGKKDEMPVTKEVKTVVELNKEINDAYKLVGSLSEKDKPEQIIKTAGASLSVWEEFAESYMEVQPEEFKRTRDWQKKIMKILEYTRKADELVKERNYDAARKESSQAREVFEEIKDENGFLTLNDEMLDLYDSVERVSAVETKEELEPLLLDLKYNYTVLKQYSLSKRYDELIAELETIIAKLDYLLDGPEFREAKNRLKPVFLELYREY